MPISPRLERQYRSFMSLPGSVKRRLVDERDQLGCCHMGPLLAESRHSSALQLDRVAVVSELASMAGVSTDRPRYERISLVFAVSAGSVTRRYFVNS
jgi:hypothetical protein